MGINLYAVAWMRLLASKGIITPGMRVLEFGPQSVHGGYEHDPAGFYRTFGIDYYRAVDLYDPTATWHPDFNEPFELSERFTLATNFGTFEHVFNIAQVFKSMHDVVEPGGVMLHQIAAFGYPDHGFYSVHPMVYLELAIINNYTIEDFRYVDAHNQRAAEAATKPVNFDDHPITLNQLQTLGQFDIQQLIRRTFIDNYRRYGGYNDLWDSCTVALRKTTDAPFRWAEDRDWKQ